MDRDKTMDAIKNRQTFTGGALFDVLGSFDQGSPEQPLNWQGSSFEPQDDIPNFQQIFHGVGPNSFQNNNNARPPRQKPSDFNRASVLQSAQNFPTNYYYPSANMGKTTTPEGDRRVSARSGKGTNPKFNENPAQQENVRPTKKASTKSPSPTQKPTNATPEQAVMATENTTATTTAAKPKPESAVQAKERMDAELEQCKKADLVKKKADLLEILATLRKAKWVAEHNAAILTNQRDKSVALHKTTKTNFAECIACLDKTKVALEVAQAELKKVQADLVQAEKEKIQSKKELAAALKLIKAKPKCAPKQGHVELNESLMAIIKTKVDLILFGFVKFIQDPSDQSQAAHLLVKFGDLPEEHVKTKEMRAQLAETYSDFIRKTLFLRRSYTTAEAKKWYEKRWKNKLPTLDLNDLCMCLERNVKTQEDMEKFQIYWEEILPQQVGKTQWNKQTRYYTTISNAVNEECTTHNINLITPEHEAFAVLSIHNHLHRWLDNFESGGKVKDKDKKKDKDKDKDDNDKDKDDNDNNNGLFTSTVSGQNLYGGWSAEGMEKFNAYLAMNIAAREDKTKAHVEKDCLQQLRAKYNIRAETFLDHQKELARKKSAKKRGKPELPMPPMKKIVRTMRLQACTDDEEEEDEDNISDGDSE